VGEKMDIEGAFQEHFLPGDMMGFHRPFWVKKCGTSLFKAHMGMGQNPGTPGEPQVIAGKWMFIPLKMV